MEISAAGDVREFRSKPGQVALTLDVDGLPKATLTFTADHLADRIAVSGASASSKPFGGLVDAIAIGFAAALAKLLEKQGEDKELFERVGIAAMWTALFHPESGHETRAMLAKTVADFGFGHVTWHKPVEPGCLLIAVSEHYIDIRQLGVSMGGDGTDSFYQSFFHPKGAERLIKTFDSRDPKPRPN